MRVIRTAFTMMIEKECPHCGSKKTADSEGKSQVAVAYCDTCGHCEDKYGPATQMGRWAILKGKSALCLQVHDGWMNDTETVQGMGRDELLAYRCEQHPNDVVLLVKCLDGND